MRRRVAMAVVATISVVVGVVGTEPMTAVATDGEMVVTEDTTLTEDHNGNIVIDADGITLDCDGHTISGSGLSTGILLEQRTGVTVRNCEVTGHEIGFNLDGSSGNSLAGNSATNSGHAGFLLNATSHHNSLSDNTAENNHVYGFDLESADDNHLEGNSASDTRGEWIATGFKLAVHANNNTLISNYATGNALAGFLVELNSDGNTLIGNESYDNSQPFTNEAGAFGFLIANDSDDVVLNANLATSNTVGFGIFGTSNGRVLTENVSNSNSGDGFHIEGPVDAVVDGNTANGNGQYGFRDLGGGNNVYRDNVCVQNADGGSAPVGLCDADGSFVDDNGNTFELDIEWMNQEGITKGCNPPTNDEFCPDDSVTRGQMAAFLVRALGYTDNGGGDLFTDDNSSIFEDDIDKLATAGVTKGCNPPTNNQYCPDDLVTRGQMAAFLVRALDYTDNGGGNLFIDDDGNTFEADIDKLGTAGVTKGCNPPTNNRFCPNDYVTRGQMAAFLRRALDS